MKQWLQVFTSRLRFKVFCAAITVAVIAFVSGWIGLSYTNTVATSVTSTTQINLPLLTNAINASNAMRSLTNRAHDLLVACEAADGSHRLLLNGSLKKDLTVIEGLATFLNEVGIREYEVKVRSALDELIHAIGNLSTICDTKAALQKQYEEQIQQATDSIVELNMLLDSLSSDFTQPLSSPTFEEGEGIREGRDKLSSSNYGIQNIWPVVQSLYLMKFQLGELVNGLIHSHSNNSVKSGNRQTQLHETAIQALTSEYQKIAPRLRDAGYLRESSNISEQLEQLSQAVVGPVGVHDIWRRANLFHSGTVIPRMELTRADIALASALQGMEMEARKRYQQATENTNRTITEARWVVAGVTSLVAVVLLLMGLFLSAQLTRPIERLKEFVLRLRKSEELTHDMPVGMLERRDEIGALAHSFNDLMVDLADARQRLLDESQAKIRTQFERLSAAIESIPQGMCLIDANDQLLMSNSRFLTLYDLTPDQVSVGTPLRDILMACTANGAKLINPDSKRDKPEGRLAFMNSQQIMNFRNERTIVVKTARTPEGGLVSIHEDITERRRQEEKITHLAHHDTLTGMANRRLFRDKFKRILADMKPQQSVALLYMDLDQFKTVNDTLGHPVGDQLLVAVAERLCSCLREMDKVARLGGDEFAILLTDNPQTEDAARISSRIIHTVGLPYDIDGQNIVVGISVGIAMAPTDGKDPDKLMKCGDMALYRAKREGRNTYWFFEPEMDAQIQAKRALELDLRHAMEANELELYYQSQIGLERNNIEGFEALLRWKHKYRGFISPADFIPIAEETGLISRIGRWVLMQACNDAMQWPDNLLVAVNISPVQFRSETLMEDIEEALSSSGLAPHRLELEITEGILMEDTCSSIAILETLRGMGVHIAMDDFGTGYSSLSYIRKFNFDKIKIDRSFVHDVVYSRDSQAVVHAVCGLCSSLGVESIAEGVETAQQLQLLKKEGCSQVQGYYFAHPMPASEVLIKVKSELTI